MKMTDFAVLVNKFIMDYLTSARNMSPNTILSYRDAIVLLLTFMTQVYGIKPERLEITDIDADRVEKFLDWLESERTSSVATSNVRLAAVHSLFRYICSQKPELILHSQRILSIPLKKNAQPEVKYLDTLQTEKLLAAPDATTKKGKRDLALLCILYDSGCRVQELADIRVRDVRFTVPPQVTLTGKGRKTRTVPLMKETAAILKNYIVCYGLDVAGKADTPLFFNNREEKLTRQGITYILQKYAEDAGIGNITPHVLRHTKAVHLTEADINPVYIRDFLGHTDLKVTQIYSKTSVQMKRKAIEKLADQKSPIPETGMEIKTKDWLDDKDLLGWLNSLGR